MEASDQVVVARSVGAKSPSGLAEMSSLEFEDLRAFMVEEAEQARAAQRKAEREAWMRSQRG